MSFCCKPDARGRGITKKFLHQVHILRPWVTDYIHPYILVSPLRSSSNRNFKRDKSVWQKIYLDGGPTRVSWIVQHVSRTQFTAMACINLDNFTRYSWGNKNKKKKRSREKRRISISDKSQGTGVVQWNFNRAVDGLDCWLCGAVAFVREKWDACKSDGAARQCSRSPYKIYDLYHIKRWQDIRRG